MPKSQRDSGSTSFQGLSLCVLDIVFSLTSIIACESPWKSYLVVLSLRIELRIHPYHGCGIPFTYKSKKPIEWAVFGADGEDRTRDWTLAKFCVTISTTPALNYLVTVWLLESLWYRPGTNCQKPKFSIYTRPSSVSVFTVRSLRAISVRTFASSTASWSFCLSRFNSATRAL